MGRQNGDAKVASSSIALLQERFKELQKIREKRQEKQLLKLFSSQSQSQSESESSSSMHFEGGNKSSNFHQPQDSLLSLRLNTQTNYGADIRGINNTPSSDLWPNSGTSTLENSDVDTSLHL